MTGEWMGWASCFAVDVELEVVGLVVDGCSDAAGGGFGWGVDGFLAGEGLSVGGLDVEGEAVEGDGHYGDAALAFYGADEGFSFVQGVLCFLDGYLLEGDGVRGECLGEFGEVGCDDGGYLGVAAGCASVC